MLIVLVFLTLGLAFLAIAQFGVAIDTRDRIEELETRLKGPWPPRTDTNSGAGYPGKGPA